MTSTSVRTASFDSSSIRSEHAQITQKIPPDAICTGRMRWWLDPRESGQATLARRPAFGALLYSIEDRLPGDRVRWIPQCVQQFLAGVAS